MNILVFERGAGKWMQIVDSEVKYTSDSSKATMFGRRQLWLANAWFEDFTIYKRTMLAVPVGTNRAPEDCGTVTSYLTQGMGPSQ